MYKSLADLGVDVEVQHEIHVLTVCWACNAQIRKAPFFIASNRQRRPGIAKGMTVLTIRSLCNIVCVMRWMKEEKEALRLRQQTENYTRFAWRDTTAGTEANYAAL